ncbi:hypothetical protein MW887_008607 [Aspergillus wentii]|nr:hypothetical protein MW887_008607 [Aspergillus wentii]
MGLSNIQQRRTFVLHAMFSGPLLQHNAFQEVTGRIQEGYGDLVGSRVLLGSPTLILGKCPRAFPENSNTKITDLPTELLWSIVLSLRGNEISALARASRNLYHRLRLALFKFNIDHQSSSALHWAITNGYLKLAKTLLRSGANINAFFKGRTPLMMAVISGSNSMTRLLLGRNDVEVNLQTTAGKSALWYSIEKGSSTIVRQLLRHPDIKVDLQDRDRQTPLLLAVFLGKEKLAKFLLLRGGDPNAEDKDGMTPWMEACIRNRRSIINLFLKHYDTFVPEQSSMNGQVDDTN